MCIMAAAEFAGRREGGPETDALVCYIKEPTLYESESSGEPMKDITLTEETLGPGAVGDSFPG